MDILVAAPTGAAPGPIGVVQLLLLKKLFVQLHKDKSWNTAAGTGAAPVEAATRVPTLLRSLQHLWKRYSSRHRGGKE